MTELWQSQASRLLIWKSFHIPWNNTPAGPGKWRTTLFGLIAASPLRLPGKVYRIGQTGKRPKVPQKPQVPAQATGPSTRLPCPTAVRLKSLEELLALGPHSPVKEETQCRLRISLPPRITFASPQGQTHSSQSSPGAVSGHYIPPVA